MGSRPRVSLSMIVKDEIAHLERCLDSIAPFVDELVIVDTGSRDGTWELVQQRADVCEQIEWSGFADARNRCLELCSGEYILVVDADEAWVDGPVRRLAHTMDAGASAVAIRIRSPFVAGRLVVAHSIWQIRMFRNDPAIRWSGRIHNRIMGAIQRTEIERGRDFTLRNVPVVLQHHGYALSPEGCERKYRPRLKLLHEELALARDATHRAHVRFHLATVHSLLGEHAEALRWADSIEPALLTEEALYSLALTSARACYVEPGNADRAETWIKVLMDLRPDEPLSHLVSGIHNLGRDKELAYSFLSAAVSMARSSDGPCYEIDSHRVAALAGDLALNLRRFEDVKNLFSHHLEKYSNPRISGLMEILDPADGHEDLLAPVKS